jgi:hypothetical protein
MFEIRRTSNAELKVYKVEKYNIGRFCDDDFSVQI